MQNDTSLVFLYYYYYYFLQSILAKEQAMKNRKKMRQCHHTFKCSINTLVIIFKKNPLDLITFYIWWIGNKFCLESMNILLLTGTQLFWPPPPLLYNKNISRLIITIYKFTDYLQMPNHHCHYNQLLWCPEIGKFWISWIFLLIGIKMYSNMHVVPEKIHKTSSVWSNSV